MRKLVQNGTMTTATRAGRQRTGARAIAYAMGNPTSSSRRVDTAAMRTDEAAARTYKSSPNSVSKDSKSRPSMKPRTCSHPQHANSGRYGGIADAGSDRLIFTTMTNGTRKKTTSHRNGSAGTAAPARSEERRVGK